MFHLQTREANHEDWREPLAPYTSQVDAIAELDRIEDIASDYFAVSRPDHLHLFIECGTEYRIKER